MCVITACQLVDNSVNSVPVFYTRPPGVHVELQQNSESSYSKHVSTLSMTHSDDSLTPIMCKNSSDCGEMKSNKKKTDLTGRAEEQPSQRDTTV